MRTSFIAGNWKMNNTPAQAEALLTDLMPKLVGTRGNVAVCVPFVCLPVAARMLHGSGVLLGAQNMHFEDKGAFTGEISPQMLVELGVRCVIIGHSERRAYFNESDELVNKKVRAAVSHDLLPIICVGETLEQREAGITDKLVEAQTIAALEGLSPAQVTQVVFAYEPIWAIGTGRTATAEEANRVIGVIRGTIRQQYGEAADSVCIQYGGSMNAENCDELMAQPEIDGGLIGGASLKAMDFSRIVHYQ